MKKRRQRFLMVIVLCYDRVFLSFIPPSKYETLNKVVSNYYNI